MKRSLFLTVICFPASAVGLLMFEQAGQLDWSWKLIGWTAWWLALFVAVLAHVTVLDKRSKAALRLDWFLPQLRRLKVGQEVNHRCFGRWLRYLAPQSWQSKHETKQRGRFRRLLRRFGTSWLASPIRRVVQAVCLIAFLFSFFYACWPYRARPSEPVKSSMGWECIGIDQESGAFAFKKTDPESWIATATHVFLRQSESANAFAMSLQWASSDTVRLTAPGDIPESVLDALLLENQPWDFYESPPNAWPSHYANDFASREWLPADLFLVLDPLVSLSTAIASRSWIWSLACAGTIVVVCLIVPRGFCGYLCPLGTTIDLFDWAIGSRTKRFRVAGDGWWVHIKYYLLTGTLVAASMGVLLSGFVSAIPVITRAALFVGEPIQSGLLRGWHLVPDQNIGQVFSIVLFLGVLCLGFLRPRFWCKYVCPSGAVFSLGNLLRITERKVESSCIHCNKCVEICPFDAIKPDFTTRGTDCTMCQSCGGVCPTHAIKFVERWNVVELKIENDPPTNETVLGRRGFLSLAGGGAAAAVGGLAGALSVKSFGRDWQNESKLLPVRPPGSVPEQEFLEMCIRCGECFKVCPNNVLQPEGFEQGLEGLWTPKVNADWAGCDSSCNACGQVCPTGAIRALTLEEKKQTRMGLAIVNETTCLPFIGDEDCDLCVQECNAAGYEAIEYVQVGTEVAPDGQPIEGTGRLAPVVLAEKCVGCGLCQTRCYAINVKDRGVLGGSAIVIEAGEGREDRLMHGSVHAELNDPHLGRQSGSVSTPRSADPEKVSPQTSNENEDSSSTIQEDEDNPFGL